MFYGLRGHKLNVALSVVAGMGFLLFGYDQGVMSGLLTLPSFGTTFPSIDTEGHSHELTASEKSHNSQIQGVTVAIYEIGCMFGALSCMYIGDKIGRRWTIFWGASIMVIGAILQAASFSLGQLIVGRVVTGLGNGFITATVPTWQSECSKAHRRGALVMIEGALIAGGIMISYWVDLGFFYVDNEASWRAPLALQVVFALFIMAFVLPMPESPRWLIKVGRDEEAKTVLAALDDVPVDDPSVNQNLNDVKETLTIESGWSLKTLLTNGPNRNAHRAALGIGAQWMQQISGINLITYYLSYVLQTTLKMDAELSRIISGANGTEYFLAAFIAIFTIESLGRRKLMLFGAVGMSATMCALAGSSSLVYKDSDKYTGAAIGAVVLMFVFNTFFAIGFLGMTWLYPAEIVSLEVRAPANAVSTASNWVSNFMVVMITPVAFTNIEYQTYIIFAVINAAMVPAIWLFYPETANRSLEEMDVMFRKVSGWSALTEIVKVADKEPFMKHRVDSDEKKGASDSNAENGFGNEQA